MALMEELPSLLGAVVGVSILVLATEKFLIEPFHSKGESLLDKVI